ncbi:L-arabinose transport system substrate-binding protein [Paucibacter oligotrophus]|uniref:L-arabinose-binding periplasmic protein n=1 Tax=Roseateles oligotrophus TaxID=1769250 RepID=A0A840LE33_9BURK|nr:substrate-binding domain-containing protein [Roseateles oligotrophus]MBB4844458.1 L-arabinose transport system substrate-binding protein [Roseateles oligotrophus]
MRRFFIKTAVSASLAAGLGAWLGLAATPAWAAPEIKIGFVIKQAEEAWFQDEWRFAEAAAKEHGFKLIKIAAPDGDRLLAAIDNLAAQRAQGLVVCVPDVKLGPALVARARQAGLKLLTVDDRLVNGAGQVMEQVPYVGVSARAIGEQVGQALLAEIKKRGWALKDVAALRVSYDQLATAKERTDGASAVLSQAGLPAAQIFSAPAPKADVENAFNASAIVLTQKPQFKHWIAFGPNDELVLGAVRAAEGKGLRAANFVGVGIGGSTAAANEFAKAEPTGFVATVMLSPRRHGYDTALAMYRWIKDGQAPAPLTLTSGEVAERSNLQQVRARLGL